MVSETIWCREPNDFCGLDGLILDHNHYYPDRTSKTSPSSQGSIYADNEWRDFQADDIYTNSGYIFFGDESSGSDV